MGLGHTAPGWVVYLLCSETWGIPPWELERLDQTDENVSVWISRKIDVDNFRAERQKRAMK